MFAPFCSSLFAMVFLAATLTLAFVAFAVRFYYATRASKKRRFVTDDTFEFQERSITFTTCKDLYRKLKREPPPFAFLPHLFQNCPEEGIEVQVEYIDTSPEDKTKPLLVALHGVPGSYMDFAKFAQYFTSSYRVVAPNFPDFSLTCAQEAFWHSNIERTHFVLDFLAALNISDIDCLVCHSAANTIASSLWSEPTSLSIKSLVLITPPSPKWLNRYQLPYAQRLVRVGSSKMQRNLFKTLWPDFMSKYVGVPTTITENTDKDGMLWMTFAAVLSNFECLHERLEILKQKQIPTVCKFCFSGLIKTINSESHKLSPNVSRNNRSKMRKNF